MTRGRSEATTRTPPPAPAVYREPGGVPTPPNLRPFSRAGTAPGKGLPVRDARLRALAGQERRGRLTQVRAAWGSLPAMDSGRGGGDRRRFRGAPDGAQACAGMTQPCRGRIVPADLRYWRTFSPRSSTGAAGTRRARGCTRSDGPVPESAAPACSPTARPRRALPPPPPSASALRFARCVRPSAPPNDRPATRSCRPRQNQGAGVARIRPWDRHTPAHTGSWT